jgi:hypothetical protein
MQPSARFSSQIDLACPVLVAVAVAMEATLRLSMMTKSIPWVATRVEVNAD